MEMEMAYRGARVAGITEPYCQSSSGYLVFLDSPIDESLDRYEIADTEIRKIFLVPLSDEDEMFIRIFVWPAVLRDEPAGFALQYRILVIFEILLAEGAFLRTFNCTDHIAVFGILGELFVYEFVLHMGHCSIFPVAGNAFLG